VNSSQAHSRVSDVVKQGVKLFGWGRRDSNPHWRRFKRPASANWATPPETGLLCVVIISSPDLELRPGPIDARVR
jgi:hypothetical protein